ncbi:uncharacterized protein LOC126651528 [Myiozetetes cayanensis]|uniref:uncharacterized protein LOC126651528 n=1 Tax=Myiozetetes cayanensis TaxID=478635 RepID=UPI00215F80A4|nr:uncharacterized protein LOC126651528 [Myiozetetes cayanensis]
MAVRSRFWGFPPTPEPPPSAGMGVASETPPLSNQATPPHALRPRPYLALLRPSPLLPASANPLPAAALPTNRIALLPPPRPSWAGPILRRRRLRERRRRREGGPGGTGRDREGPRRARNGPGAPERPRTDPQIPPSRGEARPGPRSTGSGGAPARPSEPRPDLLRIPARRPEPRTDPLRPGPTPGAPDRPPEPRPDPWAPA